MSEIALPWLIHPIHYADTISTNPIGTITKRELALLTQNRRLVAGESDEFLSACMALVPADWRCYPMTKVGYSYEDRIAGKPWPAMAGISPELALISAASFDLLPEARVSLLNWATRYKCKP